MQNISNRVPDDKVPGWWLTNCTFDLGELSLHENWALLSPRDVHLSSSVSEKAIIKNRNSTGFMMSPCLTTTLKSMDVSIFPMMIFTTLFSYMHLIAEHSLGGAPYFPIMAMSNAWLEVLMALTRSTNAIHFGGLWLCFICRMFLTVNVTS